MTHRPARNHITFGISHLEAWAPGISSRAEWLEWAVGQRPLGATGEPPLQQMPPMLRRHAGRLGRLACSPAYDALGDLRGVPIVFSSRYGEVSRSVELLTALSVGDELSPTTFGLSVHNAVAGLFSMARRDDANIISLAACDSSAEYGVIEACGLLDDGADQVLLVVADCPLPTIYSQFEESTPSAFGWSCILKSISEDMLALEWHDDVANNIADAPCSLVYDGAIRKDVVDDVAGSLAVLPLLLGVINDYSRVSKDRRWRWTRHG